MNLYELFHNSAYCVAFRLSSNKSLTSITDARWTVVPSGPHEWFADPFPFEWQGRFYIFVEKMRMWRGLGNLAVSEVDKHGRITRFKDVLRIV
jgi:hypothetical protein